MFMRWLNSQTFSYLPLMPEVWQVIWWNVCLPLQYSGNGCLCTLLVCPALRPPTPGPASRSLPTFFQKPVSPESARSSLVWATFLVGLLESHGAGCGVMMLHISYLSQSLWLRVRTSTRAGGHTDPSGIRHHTLIMQPSWEERNTIPAFPKWERRIYLS